jgi:3-oxoadipyl-CoA thiolase
MADGAREVVIVDALRTPIGRYGGGLKDVRADDLGALVISRLMERTGIEPALIEDVILGCTNQAGEDAYNVARMAALLAGLPVEVAGLTVNRLCGSGMQAVLSAAQAIRAGEGDVFIAGGTENMTRAPLVMAKPETAFPRGGAKLWDTTIDWRFPNPKLEAQRHTDNMGITAENVVERWKVSREDMDAFALASPQKAGAAMESGAFDAEIVPVSVPQRRGDPLVVARDEHPRPDVTAEQLAKLRPAFREGGSVTAGNSSGINDGAAALLVMDARTAERLGLQPMARVVAGAVAGVEPSCMGVGPIPATRKALGRAGLTADDLDWIELNEAFAAQALPCIRELGLDPDKVNPNGGAIALGHPIGSSGARILTTLLHQMRRTNARYGLATMCIGVGQGIATVVERV